MRLTANADGTLPAHRPDFGRKPICLGVQPPPEQPIHPSHLAARQAMCIRLIAAMDRLRGHQVTADEAETLTAEEWVSILAGGKRRPSDDTIRLLADMLMARDAERG